MAELKSKSQPEDVSTFPRDLDWSRKNSIILAIGVFLLAIGYIILAMVNREGSNVAGRISPFLIFFGYIVIIGSVLAGGKTKDRPEE
jgi:hypothetical protein